MKNKLLVLLIAHLWIVGLAPVVQAAESKALINYPYEGRLDRDEQASALAQAKLQALSNWIQKAQPHHSGNFQSLKNDIANNLDMFVAESVVISEKNDKSKKQLDLIVRVTLNEKALLDYLVSSTRDGSRMVDNVSADDTYITFVFVARELASRIEDKSADANSFVRADMKYQARTTGEVDTAVSEVFAGANYFVIEAALLEEETGGQLDVDNFLMDYEQGDDITSATKRNAVQGLRSLTEDPIQYLAIGTLDVDEYGTDEVSGLYEVSVSVSAKVFAIQRRGATVASIGPVQYSGLGNTIKVAENNALKLAAKKMATGLIGQLSSKSI